MKAKFPLGRIVMTGGVQDLLNGACTQEHLDHCLKRHQSGDWGNLEAEDKATNDRAVHADCRILSAYPIYPNLPSNGWGANTIWIVTEADRSVTTLLLPREY